MKFQLFNINENKYISVCKGLAEKIFIDGNFIFEHNDKKTETKINIPDHERAAEIIVKTLIDNKIVKSFDEIDSVGHRIVHGGEFFKKSSLVTKDSIEKIKKCYKLAPLHNPPAIIGIEAFQKILKNVKMTCVFDTSFHTTIPEYNYIFPVPYKWYRDLSVRRYGAHGTSYRYILLKLSKILKKKSKKINTIVCHLGNGASICVIKNGESLNTTMGLTPLGGLMMGTRSGDLDPSILDYIASSLKLETAEIVNKLNNESGFLGVSEISPDLRTVSNSAEKGNKQAILAIEIFTNRVVNYIIRYQNELANNIDALVFTGGIGENSVLIRKMIIDKIKILNIKIDAKQNDISYDDYKLISDSNSEIDVYCIRTNEELVICLDTIKLLYNIKNEN